MSGIKSADRQALYNEVWSDPLRLVAQRYGISDVGLAKICRKLQIPLPGRGYWAKVRAGRQMKRKPLPEVANGKLPYVRLSKIDQTQWEARTSARQKAASQSAVIQQFPVPEVLSDPHPLIKKAARRLSMKKVPCNAKGLRSDPGEVLHLEVTPSALDRAVLILDTLIKVLTAQGITIRIDAQAKLTLLDVEGTAIPLKLSEQIHSSPHVMTERERKALQEYERSTEWYRTRPAIPAHDYTPTGRLTLTLGNHPSRRWRETQQTRLEQKLGDIIADLIVLAAERRAIEADEARKREERQQAINHYHFLKQRREQERAQLEQVEKDAHRWERASRLRAYADAIEREACAKGFLASEAARIAWIRAKADWLDPTIYVSDPILDAPEPEYPGYWW